MCIVILRFMYYCWKIVYCCSMRGLFSEAGSELVMLRYIENIGISFRYRYIESYRIGRLNVDIFHTSIVTSNFVLEDRFYIDSDADNKEYSLVIRQGSILQRRVCLTIWHAWYFANDMQTICSILPLDANVKYWNSLTWMKTIHLTHEKSTLVLNG